jgi:hypothetical protein
LDDFRQFGGQRADSMAMFDAALGADTSVDELDLNEAAAGV